MIIINKEKLYGKILELRELLLRCGLKYPLDIFEICSVFDDIKIAAVPFKTHGLRGIANLANSTSPINCILVNSNLSQKEQNFHGIHELIHIYLPEGQSSSCFNCFDKVRPNQNPYIEWVANEGAAELMIPHDVLLPFIKEKIKTFDTNLFGVFDMISTISERYQVSPLVVENRLNSLKYEIYQYLNGCSLSNLKIMSLNQQHKLGINVDSLCEIEDRRLSENWSDRKETITIRPFFDYSDSYKNLMVI